MYTVLSRFSHVQVLATPWTVACQARVHGVLQARMLEWAALPSPRGASPDPGRRVLCRVRHLGTLLSVQRWWFSRSVVSDSVQPQGL